MYKNFTSIVFNTFKFLLLLVFHLDTVVRNKCWKQKVTQAPHSREAAGLADLGLRDVLLQMADVSASSTSCCQ